LEDHFSGIGFVPLTTAEASRMHPLSAQRQSQAFRSIRLPPRRRASIAVAILGAATLAWQWRRLKRAPAVTAETTSAGLQGRFVDIGPYVMFARETRHVVHADRPPVVLVHGLVISSRYMEPLARALGSQFRVMAPDLPGFGESGKPRHALSVVELADALRAWLRACDIETAILIGNSFGCQVLAELAVRHPDVVDRLVLQGPTTDPSARSLPRQIWRDLVNGRREPGDVARIARIDYAKAGLARALATMRILVRDRIEDKLPLIDAPTLVVVGTRDPVVPQAWAEQVSKSLPNGQLVLIEGGTHTLNYAYPDEMAEAILPFLLVDRQALLRRADA
jgi:pimeloyl-ACP methyl ester carboxylesterase